MSQVPSTRPPDPDPASAELAPEKAATIFSPLASPAPPQAVLSPEQFRKIETLQRTINKVSRRLTLLALFNLIALGLLGWSWYKDHQKLVDGWLGTTPKTATSAQPATPPKPVPAAAAAPSPSTPPVRNAANAAAAQKLLQEARELERQGIYPDAIEKLNQIKFGYADTDWPAGLLETITRIENERQQQKQNGIFR